jgi:CDP-2,3-bis-(O-geranylgeranyl)-sn-glycerol synthase
MSHDILFSLWFFMPAGFANSTPIIAAHLPGLSNLNLPMDLGRTFRGKRIFGEHKTWRGLLIGLLVGVLIVWLQALAYRHYGWAQSIASPLDYGTISFMALGTALGVGALMGDAIESFLKRQFNIASGHTWFPFDQLDFVIGGTLLSAVYVRLPAKDYVFILFIWFGMHLLFSYIGFLLKLKERPL